MSATTTPRTTVTERESRQVAEAAREQDWRKPSFAKELFLGRFRLDLIHPHPLPDEESVRRGEEFLAKLRAFCETAVDPARIEREARIPDEVVAGLKELGALGMKIDPKYGGLGLTQLYYNKALALVGSVSPAVGAPALRPPVDRRTAAAEAVRHPGAEGRLPAPLRPHRHLRVPAHRAGRGLRPGPPRHHRRPRRRRLRPRRGEAVDHQRGGRRPARGHGAGAEVRGGTRAASPRSWWRPPPRASPSSTATPSWACAASRTA